MPTNMLLGTRVIYDRSTLLALSNSDLSKTPPAKMMFVAGVTKTNGDNTSLHPSAANYRKVAELKRQEEEKKKTCKYCMIRFKLVVGWLMLFLY